MSDDPVTRSPELAAVEEQLAEARVIRSHMAHSPERFSPEEREAVFEQVDRLSEQRGEMAARLAERHRVARDLHDGPLQALSNLVLETEILERLLERDPVRLAAELAQFKDTVRGIVDDVRRQLADLGPAALEAEDLGPALRRLCADWQRETGAECRLRVTGEEYEIPRIVQQTLFWIVSEALTNVRRHAEARRVAIEVDLREDVAGVRIRDDGLGFDVTAVVPGGDPPRLGLLGMSQRALEAGGTLEVRSQLGSGTYVEAVIPFT